MEADTSPIIVINIFFSSNSQIYREKRVCEEYNILRFRQNPNKQQKVYTTMFSENIFSAGAIEKF